MSPAEWSPSRFATPAGQLLAVAMLARMDPDRIKRDDQTRTRLAFQPWQNAAEAYVLGTIFGLVFSLDLVAIITSRWTHVPAWFAWVVALALTPPLVMILTQALMWLVSLATLVVRWMTRSPHPGPERIGRVHFVIVTLMSAGLLFDRSFARHVSATFLALVAVNGVAALILRFMTARVATIRQRLEEGS